MKKALLSLALTLVAANSAFAATAQSGGTSLPVETRLHAYIAEAYPVAEDFHQFPTGDCTDNAEIAPNSRWTGGENQGDTNSKAVGGVLSLATVGNPPVLDVNAFADCSGYGVSPFVQSFRLVKHIPGSDKCPTTYEEQKFFQFGSDVRTWWTLIYTQPGTTFTLDVTTRCLDTYGRPSIHIDRYIWEVVATFESLINVIDVLHSGALGTTEIPCISSEDMYNALVGCVEDLAAIEIVTPEDRYDAQNALFNCEALVIGFACFTDCFIPQDVFSALFPPANSLQFGDYGFTGLIDTLENPCACKILVDLEYIAKCYGIVST